MTPCGKRQETSPLADGVSRPGLQSDFSAPKPCAFSPPPRPLPAPSHRVCSRPLPQLLVLVVEGVGEPSLAGLSVTGYEVLPQSYQPLGGTASPAV